MVEQGRKTLVSTDSQGRLVLQGHPNQRFLLEELPDGSIRLEPAIVMSEAQLEYLSNSGLRGVLAEAAASPTVRRGRHQRRTG